MQWSRWKLYGVLLLLWVVIFLPSIGKQEFKGEEGRRVLPAVTMLQTGNWLVPSVGGENYYSKPPGINWLVALSFIITGQENEWAARLPSALFVLLFVSLLLWMRSDVLTPSARFMAAIAYMTCISMVEKGRLIEIEAVYVSLTGIAMVWWINRWAAGGSRWLLWIVPGLVLAYAMLVKGPFAVFFFYCAVVAVLLYSHKFKELLTVPHILTAALIVFIPLGWFYLASKHSDGSKMASQMSSQLLIRIFREIDIPEMAEMTLRALANFLPWLLFIPLLWNRKILDRIPSQHMPLFKGCRIGMIVGFAVIDLLPGGLSRYPMPAIPLASVLVGWVFSLWKDYAQEDKVWRPVLLACFGIAALTAAAGLIFVIRPPAGYVVLGLTIITAAAVFRKRGLLDHPFRLTLATGVLTAVIMLQHAVFGTTIIKRHEYRRPAAMAVNEAVPEGQTVYVFKPGYQPFLFYIRPPLRYVLSEEQIDENVHYLLLTQERLDALNEEPKYASRSPEILCALTNEIRGAYKLIRLN